MHEFRLRHQDIKPSNIIHKGDRILFTDFSSAGLVKYEQTTSTKSPAQATPMYASPEVASNDRHGRGSDVFSLACVFCDMLTVVEGRTVDDFRHFIGSGTVVPLYREKIVKINEWFADSALFNDVVSQMLAVERAARPDMHQVLDGMRSAGRISACCTRDAAKTTRTQSELQGVPHADDQASESVSSPPGSGSAINSQAVQVSALHTLTG